MITATENNINLDIEYLPSQDEVFWQTKEQFVVVPKGRRAGFTRGAAQFAIECLLDGKSVLWVDTVQNNLDEYFISYFLPILRQLPAHLYDYKISTHNLTVCGNKLHMRSAERPENIEGFAYHVIILNEAGIILKGSKGRRLWHSTILPMVMDYDARVYFVGTPKGKKRRRGEESESGYCLYYELALLGGIEDHYKEEDWKTLTYTSYSNPTLATEVIQKLESQFSFSYRKQEIEGAFIDGGDETIFKESWFNIVEKVPPVIQKKVLSIDTAFKKDAKNDCSAGVVFAETKTDYYWIDCFNERLEFPQLIEKSLEFYERHKPGVILIEDKASGQSLIQMFRQQTRIPIEAIKPDTDKITRTVAITPPFQTGKVHLVRGHWNRMAIDQMCEFNEALDTPDDIVDSVSQYFNQSNVGADVEFKIIHKPRQIRRSSILEGY